MMKSIIYLLFQGKILVIESHYRSYCACCPMNRSVVNVQQRFDLHMWIRGRISPDLSKGETPRKTTVGGRDSLLKGNGEARPLAGSCIEAYIFRSANFGSSAHKI